MRNESVEKLLSGYLAILANLGQKVVVEGQQGVITGVTATGDLRVKIDSSSQSPPNNPGSNPGRPDLAAREILVKPGTIRLGYDTL